MNETRYRDAEAKLWNSVGITPTEQRVNLEHAGVTIRIQEVGEGEPILFLHGVSNSGSSWADLVARLDGFRCLLVDKPGTGMSEPFPKPFRDVHAFEAFSDAFVQDVLDALELQTAHVVSTSYGGYTALRGAAAHPERIGRIVEFGWTVGAPAAKLPALMRWGTTPILSRLMTRIPVTQSAVRMMFKQIGLRQALEAGRISQETIGVYRALLNDTNTLRNEIAAGPRIIFPKGMDDKIFLSASLLSSIQTPIYFLWGEEDVMGGADIARAFVAQIPNAQLELLPGAGHAVWMDDPDHAARVTTAFLRDN